MADKYYAGIGSRETPEDVLNYMARVGRGLERKGYRLRSGGAQGADKAFERDLKLNRQEIFLATGYIPMWTEVFTKYFHPAPQHLKDYSLKLMNRNALQILGLNGDTPVDFVVCWTKDGKASGGTGHAIRIAEFYDIPVFNLKDIDAKKALKEFINGN